MTGESGKSKQLKGVLAWYTELAPPSAELQWDSQDLRSTTSNLPSELEDEVYFEHFRFALKIKTLAENSILVSKGAMNTGVENYTVQATAASAIGKVVSMSFIIPSLSLRLAALYYVSNQLVHLAINPSTPIKTGVASLTSLALLVRDDELATALRAAATELSLTENRDIAFLFSPAIAHTREGLGVLHAVNSEFGSSDFYAEVELPTRSDYIRTAWEDGLS